jgi:hypothetical protein
MAVAGLRSRANLLLFQAVHRAGRRGRRRIEAQRRTGGRWPPFCAAGAFLSEGENGRPEPPTRPTGCSPATLRATDEGFAYPQMETAGGVPSRDRMQLSSHLLIDVTSNVANSIADSARSEFDPSRT